MSLLVFGRSSYFKHIYILYIYIYKNIFKIKHKTEPGVDVCSHSTAPEFVVLPLENKRSTWGVSCCWKHPLSLANLSKNKDGLMTVN